MWLNTLSWILKIIVTQVFPRVIEKNETHENAQTCKNCWTKGKKKLITFMLSPMSYYSW